MVHAPVAQRQSSALLKRGSRYRNSLGVHDRIANINNSPYFRSMVDQEVLLTMDRVIIAFAAFILGCFLMAVMENQFSGAQCAELEQKIGINLAYTYNDGCVRAEDL
jgi:hypothetical protein